MSVREEKMTHLVNLIENINLLHRNHSEEWLKSIPKTYNLKRLQISDICKIEDTSNQTSMDLNFDFIIYMNEYCNQLNKVYFDPFYDFLGVEDGMDFTSRIKHPDSRMSKIWHYRLAKKELGKVNANKCLNDLMGFRILTENFVHDDNTINEIKLMLDKTNVKIHNSSKGDYKATHVYFQNGNNIYFPWELQIWNIVDHDININSHALHKQSYTEWPSIYNEQQSF